MGMGAVNLEMSRNSGFALHCYGNANSFTTSSRRPFLFVATSINTRGAGKGQVFRAQSQRLNYEAVCGSGRLINDSLLPSELEFKPSFGDYLKEMECARQMEMEPSTNVKEKVKKRAQTQNRKPRLELEGVEKSTRRMHKANANANDLEIAAKKGTLTPKEASSAPHIHLQGNGRAAQPFEVQHKKEAHVMERRRLGYQTNSSKSPFIYRERRKTGNTKASLNGNPNRGNTIHAQVGPTPKASAVKDVTTTQIGYNSKGKMPILTKTLVRKSVVPNERVNRYSENDRASKDNKPENGNFNGRGTCSDYDNLEVERAAFKTFEEFNGVINKPQVPHKEMEDRIQRLANMYAIIPFLFAYMIHKDRTSLHTSSMSYCFHRIIIFIH